MTLDEAVAIVKPMNDIIKLQTALAVHKRALSRIIEAHDKMRMGPDCATEQLHDACELARPLVELDR